MTTGPVFDRMADALERHSSLSRLEARGILRVALRERNLDPKDLVLSQATDLAETALPEDLAGRGIKDAQEICRRIRQELVEEPSRAPRAAPPETPRDEPAVTVFDWVADALEKQSGLGRLQARGTLRRAFKEGGLDPDLATRGQMEVVLRELMPRHLQACAIGDGEAICGRIRADLASAVVLDPRPGAETPEQVFDRLGRT
jgi:hypothetical protein